MALPVVYRRRVGEDLAGGFGYYEGQSEGLGENFLAAVDSAFDAIGRYPEMFSRVRGEVRRALVSKFPYAVFFRVEPKRVVVLTVLHTARVPLMAANSGRTKVAIRERLPIEANGAISLTARAWATRATIAK